MYVKGAEIKPVLLKIILMRLFLQLQVCYKAGIYFIRKVGSI